MKMKKSLAIGICAVLLTGCGAQLPELSDDEMNSVGEYAAITLLKYDANSKSRLVDLALLETEEAPSEESVSVEESTEELQEAETEEPSSEIVVIDRTETNGKEVATSAEAFLELPDGVQLEYAGYDVVDNYQEEGQLYFALEASAGKKLLVSYFTLRNVTAENQNINILAQRNAYRITVNGSYTRSSLTTMLDNDMSTYVGVVASGAEKELVLLIEIDEEQANLIDNVTLEMKNEQKICTIQLY